MRVNTINRAGYAVVVEANGGEEQLTILASSGQNGKTRLIVVSMSVDFGGQVLFDGAVPTYSIQAAVTEQFRHWNRPNAIGVDSDFDADLKKLLDLFSFDEVEDEE